VNPKNDTEIARWRARMGLSQRGAAEALGMSLSGYQEQERGAGFDGRPRKPSRVLLLACAAIEAGLEPIE
jgi:transcriptional regulator with XRE-family HTH domain